MIRPAFAFLLTVSWITGISQDLESAHMRMDSLHLSGAHGHVLDMESSVIPLLTERYDTTAANIYYYLGEAYLQSGNYSSACVQFEREQQVRQRIAQKDPEGYSQMMYALTQLYLDHDDYTKALRNVEAQFAFDQSSFGRGSETSVYSLLLFADILIRTDAFLKAEHLLAQELSYVDKDHLLLPMIQGKLAHIYGLTGRYRKSNALFEKALKGASINFGKQSEEYQVTLANYGYALLLQGKYDLAEEYLETAISFVQGAGGQRLETYYALLNNLALAFQHLGQFESSEKRYSEILARDSVSLGPTHSQFAVSLANTAVLYSEQKKFDLAERALRRCLDIHNHNGTTHTLAYAKTLNVLGKVYQLSGKSSLAISTLEESMIRFEKLVGKNSVEYATALFILGSAYLETGSTNALPTLTKCEKLRAKLLGKAHPAYGQVLEKLALYYWRKRSPSKTKAYFDQTFDNYYGQVDHFFPVLTEEEKANFYFNTFRPTLDRYASWVLTRPVGSGAELGELYSHTINTKGLILFATERVKRKISESGDQALVSLFEEWETQKEMLAYQFAQTHNARAIDSLVRSSNALEKELSRRSTAFSQNMIRPKFTWRDVQKELAPGEAAIEILRYQRYEIGSGDNQPEVAYAALILTSTTLHGPELVIFQDGRELEGRSLTFYRNGIQFKMEDTRSYNTFWKPLALKLKDLGVTRVYFAPDGAYHTLALNSLRNPETNRFLIEDFDIVSVTGTRDLVQTRVSNQTGQGFMLLGFPSFTIKTTPMDSLSPQTPKEISRSMRGTLTRFLRGGAGISELPGTHAEVLEIKNMLNVDSTTVYIAEDANEANLKSLRAPKVLHIATHGYFFEDSGTGGFRPPNPLLSSGLILAGASNFIATGTNPLHPEEDGILTAYEVANMDLDGTSLVILSACETGLGHQRNGEGVYGLRRAFYLAGADAVIMSLWSVDDQATRELMTTFYELWQQSGNVHQAFRNAQLATLKKFNAPYFWGAFVVIGK
jgi:CHAT domain-containing protein/tetratricopeptide (TPR) repeat protein